MFQGLVGSGNATDQYDDMMEVAVEQGQSVTVTNIDPANTLGYLAAGDDGPGSTLAPSANVVFAQPGTYYLFPNTAGQRVTVQITGGNF